VLSVFSIYAAGVGFELGTPLGYSGIGFSCADAENDNKAIAAISNKLKFFMIFSGVIMDAR
jgi:hypothetical protein